MLHVRSSTGSRVRRCARRMGIPWPRAATCPYVLTVAGQPRVSLRVALSVTVLLALSALLLWHFTLESRLRVAPLPTLHLPAASLSLSSAGGVASLRVLWQFGAGGCSGFFLEAMQLVLALQPHLPLLGILVPDLSCTGMSDGDRRLMEEMRERGRWMAHESIDIFVSHKAPPNYPRFPMRRFLDQAPFDRWFASNAAYASVWARMLNAVLRTVQPWFHQESREWVEVSTVPTYVIGRSMSEWSLLPASWALCVTQRVDEVWVPSPHSRDSFLSSGVPHSRIWMLEEPIDPVAYDPDTVVPLWDIKPAKKGKGRGAETEDADGQADGDAEEDEDADADVSAGVDASRIPRLLAVSPSSTPPFSLLRAAGSFNFLSVFKWERRKGWPLLVRAFVEEFSARDDVTLTIHTRVPAEDDETRAMQGDAQKQAEYVAAKIRQYVEEHPEIAGRRGMRAERPLPLSRLLIHTDSIPLPSMPALYASFSSFVLPTHGEGWGLPLMESMAMALPTAATHWGGQLAFMQPSTSFLIDVERFESADVEEGGQEEGDQRVPMWAVASVTHLRKIMRHMVSSPASVAAVGAAGRASIVTRFTGEQLAARIVDRLATHVWPFIMVQRQDFTARS